MTAPISRWLLRIIVPFTLVAAWFVGHALVGHENSFVVDPLAVVRKLVELRSDLAANTLLSIRRLLVGVVLGTGLGTAAGVTVGRSRLARQLFGATLGVMTAVPIIVFVPFFLMVFGFEAFRVALISCGVGLVVYHTALQITRGFPTDWLELAAHRAKSEWQIVAQMILPSGIPELIGAVRVSLLFSWLSVAIAEKAVAEWPRGGLGYQILRAREQGLFVELFAAVVVLAAVAWTLDTAVAWMGRASSHWRNSSERIR